MSSEAHILHALFWVALFLEAEGPLGPGRDLLEEAGH